MLARRRKFLGGANAVVKPEPGKKIKLPVKALKSSTGENVEAEDYEEAELDEEVEPVTRTVSTGECSYHLDQAELLTTVSGPTSEQME